MISFDEAAMTRLVSHAESGVPFEVCGVMGGVRGDDFHVDRIYPVENVSETPRVNYYMEPEEQLRVLDQVEGDGLEVVGFYHSHPEGPRHPSETDRDRATWPGHVYVIVSLDGDEPWIGAWLWEEDDFVSLEVVESD